MSVSDLTGTTWYFNETLSRPQGVFSYTVSFTSNNTGYTSLTVATMGISYGDTIAYMSGSWRDQAYRTVTFTGGADATNATLIEWLEANATLQAKAVNKVQIVRGNQTETLIDLTADTVAADKVLSGYTAHDASGATITGSIATRTVTPTATKGTVSNHSVSVTPSVAFPNAGYVVSGTKTGTAVTVSASELVSGNLPITQNGTNIDVTNYATVSVAVQGGGGVYQDENGYLVLREDAVTGLPTGNIPITSNGTYDVTDYAGATVNVTIPGTPTLLKTESLGSVVSSSTTQTSLDKSITVSGCSGYDLLLVEATVDTVASNKHVSTITIVGLGQIRSNPTSVYGGGFWNTKTNNAGEINTAFLSSSSSGVYVTGGTVSGGTVTLPMYVKYNSTTTNTIDGTYTAKVYGMNLIDFIGLGAS